MMQESAIMTESAYPESPLDLEEAAYPCKGCGEILEEGKAFELAGNRWHIDCFRCNTCGTLLDSDANLLLLGDGSLICNNCTYSCSSCGNKIEDLAILTGDQAFCANCFKCRNCKRKIENLRYARTSQGIFCMECHEALMARRRKKTARGSERKKNSSLLDKSLPAIPPPEARKTTYIPGTETLWSDAYPGIIPEVPSVATTLTELRSELDADGGQPSASLQNQSIGAGPSGLLGIISSTTAADAAPSSTGLTLPSTTYRNQRMSYQSVRSDISSAGGAEEFLIPLAFDPNPPEDSSALKEDSPRVLDDRPRDYFNRSSSQPQAPTANSSKTASPHIAYQEKGRQKSHETVDQLRTKRDGSTSRSESATASPFLPERSRQRLEDPSHLTQIARNDRSRTDDFKLQEAPRSRGFGTSVEPKSTGSTPRADISNEHKRTPTLQEPLSSPEPMMVTPRVSQEASPVANGAAESPRPTQTAASNLLQTLPKRGDSLESANAANKRSIPRKEVNAAANIPAAFGDLTKDLTTSPKPTDGPTDLTKANGGKIISGPITSLESHSILDTPNAPQFQGVSEKGGASFVEPRAAPAPPPSDPVRSRTESLNTIQSESQRSPKLPRWSAGGDFTLEEDMARILGGDEPSAHESFLRRVSNSVRHGRSYSDKSGRVSRDRWPRSPIATTPGHEISSPSTTSPEHRDELTWFKNELRRERQKTLEREKKIAELEFQLDSTANIKQVNSELREKRSTMVVLDAQKELVVRELETLTEHIAKAKASKEPLDLATMSNSVLRDFAESLERLKNSFAPQVEEFIEKRNDLLSEIANLNTMKDKNFQEFEQLSSKNAQLAELNNQLVHQIQDIYKANSNLNPDISKSPAPNGLGIYSHHKDKSQISIDSREVRTLATESSYPDSGTTLQGEAEPISVIGGPNVVSIKKIQPKKFDWRKGQKVAKGMAKGVKGAFSSTQQSYNRDMQFAETGAYGQIQHGQDYSSFPRNNLEPNKQAFGFFGNNQKAPGRGNGLYANSQGNASTPSLLPDPSTNLFGADLEQRAEYERTDIPGIVKRCVQEVESRGMDVEGIYRKSGANSQVQQVKDSFEHPGSELDLSDPDFDVHAITSGLKQYFRKLPIPLITYDVYDRLLESTQIPEGPSQKTQRIAALQTALEELPRVHYQTLEYLVRHLARVVVREKENLMTPMNIAVVFAPTIMRPESVSRELSDTKAKNEVVMWIVEDYEKIFD